MASKTILTIPQPLSNNKSLKIPLINTPIKAGFPSPAMDFEEVSIDLNEEIIEHPSSTFFSKVAGDSMKDKGIHDGDLLVIDKSLEPDNGKVAVCFLDGEFTLKTIKKETDCVWLLPANDDYKPIKVSEGNELIIWGIVTYVIKKF